MYAAQERSARLREGVELIQKVWTEDAVTFDGRFTQVKDLTLSPKPVQQPMPMWIGARAEKATRNAARLGCHLMATLGPDPAPWYIDELKKCGRNPDDFNIAQLRLVYLADTEDQAWADCQDHLFSMMEFYGHILAEANDAPGDKDVWQFTKPSELRHSAFGEAVMIGTPDQVAQKMERFKDEFQCTHLIDEHPIGRHGPQEIDSFAGVVCRKSCRAFGGRADLEKGSGRAYPIRLAVDAD